jgi:hypothetical protein
VTGTAASGITFTATDPGTRFRPRLRAVTRTAAAARCRGDHERAGLAFSGSISYLRSASIAVASAQPSLVAQRLQCRDGDV